MRKITSFIAALLLSVATFAQVPQGFSYQAVVRDAQNAIVANQDVEVTVTILQGATADAAQAVFSEKHNAKTNANGLFTLAIGSVDAANFAAINWAGGNLFLKTESKYGTATTQLLSVPFAMFAAQAGSANVDLSEYAKKTDIPAEANLTDYAKTAKLNDTLEAYVLKKDVPAAPDLSGYALKTDIPTEVSLEGYATTAKLNDTLAVYAKIADLPEGVNLTGYALTDDLAAVATTGSYNDLTNKPTIPTVPTNVGDFTNNVGYLTTTEAASTYATNNSLKTVATSGSYTDLTNKPTIPTKVSQLTADKIGDMPMATVKIKVLYRLVNSTKPTVTIKFCGKTVNCTSNNENAVNVKIPAYMPVYLSVALSQYGQDVQNGDIYGNFPANSYMYNVSVNGTPFDNNAGYYSAQFVRFNDNITDEVTQTKFKNKLPAASSSYSDKYVNCERIKTLQACKVKTLAAAICGNSDSYYQMYERFITSDEAFMQDWFVTDMKNQAVGPFEQTDNTITIVVWDGNYSEPLQDIIN